MFEGGEVGCPSMSLCGGHIGEESSKRGGKELGERAVVVLRCAWSKVIGMMTGFRLSDTLNREGERGNK